VSVTKGVVGDSDVGTGPPGRILLSVEVDVDLDGVELRTDDIDWSLGSGTPVVGAAEELALALALVLSGRRLPTGLLHGQGSERFSA